MRPDNNRHATEQDQDRSFRLYKLLNGTVIVLALLTAYGGAPSRFGLGIVARRIL